MACLLLLRIVQIIMVLTIFPEKLIPHVILNAISGQPLPIYGDGSQIRDWLYVEDHAQALLQVVTRRRGR